jgi:hypothetical protein
MANSIICQEASTCRVDAGLPNLRCSVHPRCVPNQQRRHTFMWCDDLVEFDGARMSKFLKKMWVKERNVEPEHIQTSTSKGGLYSRAQGMEVCWVQQSLSYLSGLRKLPTRS